jgi:hypothetical protein
MRGIDAARHSDDRPRRPTTHELIAGTTTPSPSPSVPPMTRPRQCLTLTLALASDAVLRVGSAAHALSNVFGT